MFKQDKMKNECRIVFWICRQVAASCDKKMGSIIRRIQKQIHVNHNKTQF